MFSRKKLVVVTFVLVLAVIMSALPSLGATFRNRVISDQQFLDLCKQGDANAVMKALNTGSSANTKDKEGRSALMYASAYGNVETVNALIRAGADVTHYGGASIIHAAAHGNSDIIEVLIQNGADVNTKNNSGTTALMLSSREGYVASVTVLLKAGAEVNARNNNGWTALMYASENGYTEVVKALLNAQADVNIQNERNNSGEASLGGRTAVMLAAKNGHTEIAEALIDAGADDKFDNKGKTALIHAAESGNSETVSLLVHAGSYVKQIDADGKTVLDYARKNPKVVGTPIFHYIEQLSK